MQQRLHMADAKTRADAHAIDDAHDRCQRPEQMLTRQRLHATDATHTAGARAPVISHGRRQNQSRCSRNRCYPWQRPKSRLNTSNLFVAGRWDSTEGDIMSLTSRDGCIANRPGCTRHGRRQIQQGASRFRYQSNKSYASTGPCSMGSSPCFAACCSTAICTSRVLPCKQQGGTNRL